MKSREVEAILKRYGFELISQKGSHRKWRNTELGLQVIVPEHKGKDLPTGTLRNILKGAQIPKSEWKKQSFTVKIQTKGAIAMKVKGIIQGNTVKLLKTVSVPDGTEVMVEIPDNPKMTEEQRKEKLKQFFAIPSQDTEELVAVLTELENERNEKIDSEIGIL